MTETGGGVDSGASCAHGRCVFDRIAACRIFLMKYRLRLWLLRIVGVLLRLLRPTAQTATARAPGHAARIVVLRPDQLGDVLLSRPAIDALAASLPSSRVTVVVGPWARPALGEAPGCRVMEFPFPGFVRETRRPLRPYLLLLRYAKQLRRDRFDMAVVLRPDHWWGALLVALAGIPIRVGYDTPETAPFLTTALPLDRGRHAVEQALTLEAAAVRAVGGVPVTPAGNLPSSATEANRAPQQRPWRRWESASMTRCWCSIRVGGAVEILAAGALWRGRAALSARLAARVVVTGSEGERELALRLAALIPDAVSLAGRFTWDQLEALLARADLVVGVDSGPLHLAVAAGTPSVALFGPADPAQFAPWGPAGRHRIVAADLPCRPCRRLDYCALEPAGSGPPPCMRAITVPSVIAAALDVAGGKERNAAAAH